MAQTSFGFAGSINDAQWATVTRFFGREYCVAEPGHLRATPTAGVRRLTIAAGTAFGSGVTTVLSTSETVDLPTPTAGQWFLIALRRVWSLGATSLVVVPGTTTAADPSTFDYPLSFPAARKATPGVEDDQPLYWVHANNLDATLLLVDIRKPARFSDRFGSAAERDAFFGVPSSLADRLRLTREAPYIYRSDMRWFEAYVAQPRYGSPGWFPVAGAMPTLDISVAAGNTFPDGAWTLKTGLPGGVLTNHGGFVLNNSDAIVPFYGRWDLHARLGFPGDSRGSLRAGRFLLDGLNWGEEAPFQVGFTSSTFTRAVNAIAFGGGALGVQGLHNATVSLSVTMPRLTATYLGPL